jgi:drug/metabolite transporter (DMT)-like permease
LGNELTPASLSWAILGLLSITAGTIYQRRFCPAIDLRVGSALQFGAALVVTLPFAFLFETREVMWTPQFTGALAWSVLALSIGSVSLLFLLIRRGAATRVASLMYLTPGVTAVMAWMLFGEALTAVMILGLVISAVGVAWATGKR